MSCRGEPGVPPSLFSAFEVPRRRSKSGSVFLDPVVGREPPRYPRGLSGSDDTLIDCMSRLYIYLMGYLSLPSCHPPRSVPTLCLSSYSYDLHLVPGRSASTPGIGMQTSFPITLLAGQQEVKEYYVSTGVRASELHDVEVTTVRHRSHRGRELQPTT